MLLVWKYIYSICLKKLILVDDESGHFVWDVEEIEIEIQTVKDVLKNKISLLPEISQENLKMAACLGSRLDKDILLRLFSTNEEAVTIFIDDAVKAHIVVFDDARGTWCFAHDYVQEEIYRFIPIKERNLYHYRIGRKLWREFDIDELGSFLFLVVGQLLLGVEYIKDCRERVAVAKLCLGAGVRAVQLSNFQASYKYLKSGISLLDETSWENEYDLTMSLHNAAAEVANSIGMFSEVHTLVDKSLFHSKTFEHSHRAQATRVHALGRDGRLEEAVGVTVKILDSLGEKIMTNQSALYTKWEISYLRWRIRNKTNQMILRIPIMTDQKKLAAMEMMNLIFLYTSLVKPELTSILGCRMVQLSLDHGLSAFSCIGFVSFAVAVAR
jgi:predicted ATPase